MVWKPSPTSEPDILLTAVLLYVTAIVWAIIRGPDSFLAGMLSGCGSIAIGVWIGLVVSHQRGYTPEGAVQLKDVMDDTEEGVDVEDEDDDWRDLRPR